MYLASETAGRMPEHINWLWCDERFEISRTCRKHKIIPESNFLLYVFNGNHKFFQSKVSNMCQMGRYSKYLEIRSTSELIKAP